MPGNFVIAALALIFSIVDGFDHFAWWWIAVLLGMAIAGELLEFILGTFTNVKFGASRWGVFGAFTGGIAGSIFGTMVLPVIGTILGAILGAFTFSFLFEQIHRRDLKRSFRAGYGASVGIVIARGAKIVIGAGMIVILVSLVW
jgi:hypothetical protein